MTWKQATRAYALVVNLFLYPYLWQIHMTFLLIANERSVNCLFIAFDHFSTGLFLKIYIFQILNFVGYISCKYILPVCISSYFFLIFEGNCHAYTVYS